VLVVREAFREHVIENDLEALGIVGATDECDLALTRRDARETDA
jgi:hypothetical protein